MMKIARIDTYLLKAPLGEKTFWSSQCRFSARKSLLVRIETASGLAGWGEAGQYGPAEPVSAAIHSVFAPMVLGQDARTPEVLWERMYSATRDYGRGGGYIEAISGIDIALWDILGKHLGVPIHTLFGGAFRKQVCTYATGLYYTGECPTLESNLEALSAEASAYAAAGFTAVKMKIGLLRPEEDIQRVADVRKAIGNRILLVDANHAYAAHVAAQVVRSLEKYDVFWFEEPVVPEDIEGYLLVKKAASIAIAGGECEHTRYGFAKWFSARALDIAQPDVCCAGGLSEVRRIAAMASAMHVSCFPHVWGTSLAITAGLHLLAVLPPSPATARPVPPFNEPLLEWDSSPSPLRTAIFSDAPKSMGGKVNVPDGPGLGIQPDVETFEPFLAQHLVTDTSGTREVRQKRN